VHTEELAIIHSVIWAVDKCVHFNAWQCMGRTLWLGIIFGVEAVVISTPIFHRRTRF
jgi:hypothetical protein